MTGLTLPAAISSVRVATSSALKGFHQISRPIHLSVANEITGPNRSAARIGKADPPSVT